MSADLFRSAADAVAAGEVIGVPTDTVYGIAADPWNESAVLALFALKGRPKDRPVGLLAGSVDQAEEVVRLGSARGLADRHWPGALTLVVEPRVVIPDWVGTRAVRTVGIRVPDHPDLRRLLVMTGPLAVTSANRSGEPEVFDEGEAREVFGEAVAVYMPGRSPGTVASTVVDATGPEPIVLRPGPVSVRGD